MRFMRRMLMMESILKDRAFKEVEEEEAAK